MLNDKIEALAELNKQLSPPDELCGLFLPPGTRQRRDDILLLAEMPSMNEPCTSVKGPYNFGVTARDRFFREMLVKHGLAGVYVTDMVKRRDVPGRPTEQEIVAWLPFLKEELDILKPGMILVIGKRTYDSFLRHVVRHIGNHFHHDFIFHYCSQVPRGKFETRLKEIVERYDLSRK